MVEKLTIPDLHLLKYKTNFEFLLDNAFIGVPAVCWSFLLSMDSRNLTDFIVDAWDKVYKKYFISNCFYYLLWPS